MIECLLNNYPRVLKIYTLTLINHCMLLSISINRAYVE